ncbi:FAD-binding oxidoreductase [Lysobacter brunescens]|uniref:FAD-binding oxidoreductase n=1 Tax=Lysobacter brunescens TaxID=262323 RepID=A0ABW2Y9L5_9GAMM
MSAALAPAPCPVENDVHSGLNPTRHLRAFAPRDVDEVVDLLQAARRQGRRLAVAGARHAMGGQQFAEGGWLLDTQQLSGVHAFDPVSGRVRVGAGTRWPALQAFLAGQRDREGQGWAIRQKQTGADDFSIGGALAANIHGRGLDQRPFVDDIEAFTLVRPDGQVVEVDRQRAPHLFSLAVGGYGLFGVVTDVTLRLAPRRVLQRRVSLLRRGELMHAFEQARSDGALYGDFQFSIDPDDERFLDDGIFACYYPTHLRDFASSPKHHLSAEQFRSLLMLAHTDKREAFERYCAFYLTTHGQHYGSDDHQFGVYLDGYHRDIDRALGHVGSEMITELYVPPGDLDAFLGQVADDCRRHGTDIVYGTVRMIRRETDTLLAWAREDWACVVLNLHVRHDEAGRQRMRADTQRLIDRALAFGGSFYLTYHREARADQLRAAYPRIDAFLEAKSRIDPDHVLDSDWHRALRATLSANR